MEQVATQTPTTEAPAKVEIDRQYFEADQHEKAVELSNKLQEEYPHIDWVSNFDLASGEIPAGGLVIFPLNNREEITEDGETKRVVTTEKLVLASVPSVSAILAGDLGEKASEFAQEMIAGAFMDKLFNTAKGTTPLPKSLEDFITTRGRSSEFASYNAVSKDLVTAAKDIGLKMMTAPLLRSCLENQAYCDQTFGDQVPAVVWDRILEAGKVLASKAGKDVAIFDHWKATRNEATAPEIKLNLDSLSGLLGDDA